MKRLSKPISKLDVVYDAIVVGSGYGGSAAASRLARMGLRVALLERGEELIPGEYPDTPTEVLLQAQVEGDAGRIGPRTALFDLRVGKDINVLIGCGLGGTSLINANVALEANPRVFDDTVWPAGLRNHLDEGYERARAMLKPRPYPAGHPDFPLVNKLTAMDAAAEALGARRQLPPISVAFEEGYNPAGVWQPACNLCGDCCSGCNIGAKSTTLMNYLPDAAAFGAEIFCGLRVRSVSAKPGGGWNVH
jgi:cholesterol oxidase